MTTLAHYETVLNAGGEQYVVLPLQDDASALITRRGGRVLGLFPAPDRPNLFWTSKAFDSTEAFKIFITRSDGWAWNLGGERCWIAPEITYNVRDRHDFGGTWDIPKVMDPGNYELVAVPDRQTVLLDNRFELTGYDQGQVIGKADLYLRRVIKLAPNPLADHAVMRSGVKYMGYLHEVMFSYYHPTIFAEVWNLVQLNAGGTLIIPVTGSVQASDYVKPVPDFARQVKAGVLYLPLNGIQQFKIGYKALCMTGRMGYLHDLPDGQSALLVREFPNDPSNRYAEEPPDDPGNIGHSVHIYNDGGTADNGRPFGEMECSGHTLGEFTSHRAACKDIFNLWAYVGTPDTIREIAKLLLGSVP